MTSPTATPALHPPQALQHPTTQDLDLYGSALVLPKALLGPAYPHLYGARIMLLARWSGTGGQRSVGGKGKCVRARWGAWAPLGSDKSTPTNFTPTGFMHNRRPSFMLVPAHIIMRVGRIDTCHHRPFRNHRLHMKNNGFSTFRTESGLFPDWVRTLRIA